MLPHELIHVLWVQWPLFRQAFCGKPGDLEAYWTYASREPWFADHPCRQHATQEPARTIPLRLHGDDAPLKKGLVNLSGLCLSFASPLTWAESPKLSVFPIFYLILKGLIAGTEERLYDVVA
eukprot:8590731-Alexandrium_andersonii.AAC.1